MTDVRSMLANELKAEAERLVAGREAGHCARLDDIELTLALDLAQMFARDDRFLVGVLREHASTPVEMSAERAIELRNRKSAPLLLLVPAGEGHAASSLDNSFERTPMVQLLDAAARRMHRTVKDPDVAAGLGILRRANVAAGREAWAEFLAAVAAVPTLAGLGANLWRIGLVPDVGEDVLDRLAWNAHAVANIARPTRPAASIDERLNAAGVQEGSWRFPLRQFLEAQREGLVDPTVWARELVQHSSELSFERWVRVEQVEGELQQLVVDPFQKADGSVEKRAKLSIGGDGQLVLRVPDGGVGKVTVHWRTTPGRSSDVERWRLDLERTDTGGELEADVIASITVKGANGSGTLSVQGSKDELLDLLAEGSRFLVRVTAVGEGGQLLMLRDGTPATAESQEFEVVLDDAEVAAIRRTATTSLAHGALRAVLDGIDDLTEDLPTWDLAGQAFGVRLGNRRAIQVRVNEHFIGLQRRATASPERAFHAIAKATRGGSIETIDKSFELQLPGALRRARTEFLMALRDAAPRDTVEAVQWTSELRKLAQTLIDSYRRALDGADAESSRSLALLDAVSIDLKHSRRDVRAVALLPIHPLRVKWLMEHDGLVREWADELRDLPMRGGARRSAVNERLVEQIVPANLPFVALHHSGDAALYFDELSFGTGLYLVPSEVDTDAAAQAVATALGMVRKTVTLGASARMLADRLRAYESAHDVGAAVRLLALNPGSGALLAAALEDRVLADPDAPSRASTPRMEAIAYTESASYVAPLPALTALQTQLREQGAGRGVNHLAPPLGVSVREVDRVSSDAAAAHVAVMQDVAQMAIGTTELSDRRPALDGLLVSLTTRFERAGDEATWWTTAATNTNRGAEDNSLALAHAAHQKAIGRALGGAESHVPSVFVSLGRRSEVAVASMHERADWVVSIDRFVGANLFEEGLSEPFILDYAPDFVEGIGERMTVTTTRRDEVEELLSGAMRELGLDRVDQSVGVALDHLSVVSGRLALRLLQDSTHAREAVSLAALVHHLKARGELSNTIVVPIDAHPEIFGASAREEGGQRCDLLLVRLGQRSFKIECVEVKSRKEARLPDALAQMIVGQLDETRRLLSSLYFSDPPRVDAPLQRARLASLLHYYADRAASHGLFDRDRLVDVHQYIDRVEESGEPASISMRGYVVSLLGDDGFKKSYGDVPITVLNAQDLGKLGYTLSVPIGHEPRPHPSHNEATTPDRVVAPSGHAPTMANDPAEGEDLASPERTEGEKAVKALAGSEPSVPARESSAMATDMVDETAAAEGNKGQASILQLEVQLGEDAGGEPVRWRVSTKGSPHAFVVGIPGQGKSVTTRHIVRSFAEQELPSFIIDFHGDMAREAPEGSVVVDAGVGLPFNPFDPGSARYGQINSIAWEVAEVLGYVGSLGQIQKTNVYKALQSVYVQQGWHEDRRGERAPTVAEFKAALEDVESGGGAKHAVARLLPLTDFGLFASSADGAFNVLDPARRTVVVDLSTANQEDVQKYAASFLLRRVYRDMFSWPQDGTMKLAVVLDEAHRLAGDVTLPKLMKEGRKYGVSVVVASQSADDFHKDVTANAGTKIVFRTNFPASKGIAGLLRGRNGVDLSQEIERLPVGSAFVATSDAPQARRTFMSRGTDW
ncbi:MULTISPECIES: ATP-binding protein [unclassified Agrococcus]|uniref:ATP-binding protein n=1 Tax=unclassified Agrococcus TaxID=2615065 RepID=UPI00361254EE